MAVSLPFQIWAVPHAAAGPIDEPTEATPPAPWVLIAGDGPASFIVGSVTPIEEYQSSEVGAGSTLLPVADPITGIRKGFTYQSTSSDADVLEILRNSDGIVPTEINKRYSLYVRGYKAGETAPYEIYLPTVSIRITGTTASATQAVTRTVRILALVGGDITETNPST